MGRPKPLCAFGSPPRLELVLDACSRAGVPRIVVLGHTAAEVKAGVKFGGAQVIVNPDYAKGQTSSLQAGLRALPSGSEAFLLFPADHPLITEHEIKPLL